MSHPKTSLGLRRLAALWLAGCTPAVVEPPSAPAWYPLPSIRYSATGDGLPALPQATTALPLDRLRWRDGWSPVQSSVYRPEVAIDPATLPGPFGEGYGGSVRLYDLTDGVELRAFAEIDAYPDEGDGEIRVLLVRPMQPMAPGHRIAAVVTPAVRTVDGAPFEAPGWFEGAVAGTAAPSDPAPDGHDAALLDAVRALGASDAVFAWDWTVGHADAPLLAARDALTVPSSWSFDEVTPGDGSDPRVARTATGTFRTVNLLGDDGLAVLDNDGLPSASGDVDADLVVFVPTSAQPGGPVWLFGHGIFSNPLEYLGADGVLTQLAYDAGAVVVATTWRGLTTKDLAIPVGVGGDFGRIPELTDRLTQGVTNTLALASLVVDGDLLSDPVFGGLGDRDGLRYFGISLGGIEGATTLANADPNVLRYGVFHVGGSTWSTMLERSKNWSSFEGLVEAGIDSPADRQTLYALSQLFWDPVDPAIYADRLAARDVLWQIALGDDQVPNLTSWTLARGAGATLLAPAATPVPGLALVDAPAIGPTVAQFDPETTDYEGVNRPSPETNAHDLPRLWPGMQTQVRRFLDADDPGVIVHACGAAPCSASNPGEVAP
jgi:hypothetical protein